MERLGKDGGAETTETKEGKKGRGGRNEGAAEETRISPARVDAEAID